MLQTIIIGSGGTTSYALPHLIRYYSKLEETRTVTILDRDRVEERNLLRQGFLQSEVNKYKGEVLARRLSALAPAYLTIQFTPIFINSVQDLLGQVLETTSHLTLICGADNNMARLRIHIAAYVLQDLGKRVDIIDSGNAEFHGQVMISRLMPGHQTFLTGISQAIQGSLEQWKAFRIKRGNLTQHKITSVFTPNANWRDRLNRGEHELGCQDNIVINPQNIAANMTAGTFILKAQHALRSGDVGVGIYKFDTIANSEEYVQTPPIEEGYAERIADILEYLQTDEGVEAIFGTIPPRAAQVEQTAPTVVRRAATRPRRTTVTPRRVDAITEELLGEVDAILDGINTTVDLDAILDGM